MLIKADRKGHITGFMNSLYPEGVLSLQYAYDTLLFLKHDTTNAGILKCIMVCFEQLSRMKINYNKSDLVSMNLDEDETIGYAKIFCRKVGSFPFKYLGVPLHYEKLRRDYI
jgi:hypothetical protein